MSPIRPTTFTVLTLTAAVALLSGCGSHPTRTSPQAPAASVAPSIPSTEGSAADAHTWPDGITVQVVKVEPGNRAAGLGLTPDLEPVKVTIAVHNAGTQPFPLVATWHWVVVYGPNHAVADRVLDAAGDTGRTQSVDPEQVGAGQTVTLFDTSAVPNDQLGQLAIQLDLDPSEQTVQQFTFTGVQVGS